MSSFFNSMLGRSLILIVLVLGAYAFALNAPFKTMDDRFSIVQNPLIKDPQNIPHIFTRGYFNDQSYYRPLPNLSFLLEYQAFKLNSFYYNLDNHLLHAFNAVLVFILIGLLTSNRTLGFWVGVLYAIHPIHWEAVCNVPGRAILMTGFFELGAFVFFLLAYLRREWLLMIVSIVLFATALLCKESAGVFPLILGVYLLTRRDIKLTEKIAILVPFFVVLGGYVYVRHSLGITKVLQTDNIQIYTLGFLTFLKSLMTQLRLMFLPIDLHFDRGTPFFPNLTDPSVGLTVGFWVVVVAAISQWRRNVPRFVFFLMAWFILEMLPVSQLVASVGVQPGVISSAEHFMYMSSIPLLTALVYYFYQFRELNLQKKYVSPKILKFLVGGFMAFLFITAMEQSIYASSELAMLKRSIDIQPNNARIQASIGLQYVFRENFAEAEKHFQAAVDADPFNARYRISLGTSKCQQDKWIACMGEYIALDEDQDNADLKRQMKLTIGHINDEIKAGKDYDAKGWFILGVYYAKAGDVPNAIASFDKALAKNPDLSTAWMNLGSLYESQHQYDQAKGAFERLNALPNAHPAEKVFAQQRLLQMQGH